ncbi:MAG: metal-dependent hydrolase [Methanomicrobiales archaeon]
MNRQAHLIIGIMLFLGYGYGAGLLHQSLGSLLVVGILATLTGSHVPDILEPPTSARHRGICHSRRALKCAAVLFLVSALPVLLTPCIPCIPLTFSGSCFFLGYAGHLLADSLTRAGLPR